MSRNNVKQLVMAALMTALMCIMSMISLSLGPVAFTLSLLAVFLTGAVLMPAYAVASSLVYIALGATGLPVFSNMTGGIGVLIGPTGGYIIAYPVMTLIIALCVRRFGRKLLPMALSMAFALVVCYLFGTLWFMHYTGREMWPALTLCVFPFVPFDACKAAVAVSAAKALQRAHAL